MAAAHEARWRAAAAAMREGRPVLLTDDDDRENEADLIVAATAPGRGAGDIVSPGHVFPIVASDGGVLARRGHTEGALELCALAALRPAAVLCELMNADGTMARGAQIDAYAARHGLPLLSIEDLVAWRRREGATVRL